MSKLCMVLCVVMLSFLIGCSSIDDSEEMVSDAQVSEDTESAISTIESIDETTTETEEVEEVFEPIQMDDEKEYDIFETLLLTDISDNNTLGDTGEKYQIVYLPPSYYSTDKNYPVIYYFHGHLRSPSSYDYFVKRSRDLMMVGELEEVIVVAVNTSNPLQGTFLRNSPATGNWEDAFFNEIMPYMEENYRTINTKEGRALLGFSMGGNSAMYLAFNYPELFGGVYAVAPDFVKDDQINEVVETWSTFEQRACGAVFAPNIEVDFGFTIPMFDGSEEDQIVVEQWLSGIGQIDDKVSAYVQSDVKVERIGLEVASNDPHYWIVDGVTYLSETLTENGIENQFEVTQRGHAMILPSVIDTALPFLLEGLTDAY